MTVTRVWREAITRRWRAEHSDCGWTSHWPTLAKAHTEATYHTCTPILGPRPLPPGTTIVSTGQSTPIRADMPAAVYRPQRFEVWL